MKVYISGAITGVENYKEQFDKAQKELEKQGFEVINPTLFDKAMPENTTYEEYMKLDLFLLDLCDSIYMLKNWNKSCGANREYGYALAQDKIIMYEKGV